MIISVIIPVYNSEKYISKCLDSVIAQTYSRWEIICIDDGSTDKSSEIICDYQKRYENINLIVQSNAGPGVARNEGIKKAKGEYIVFLDSDDYISPNYFKYLVEKADKSDVIFINVRQVTETGKKIRDEKMSSFSSYSKDRILRHQMTGKIPWGGCRKVVKRELLLKNNIFFSDTAVGEEALFSFCVLSMASHTTFLGEEIVYFYVNHLGSQSKSVNVNPLEPVRKILDKYLKNSGENKKYYSTMNALDLTAFLISVDRASMYFSFRDTLHYVSKEWKIKKMSILTKNLDFDSLNLKAQILYPLLKINCIFLIVIIAYIKNELTKRKN